jgi:hypothetical protein
MATSIDRDALRDWIIDRIEEDAPGSRGEQGGTVDVYFGRIDALIMFGPRFELWSLKMRDRIGNWVDNPKGRPLRDVLR